MRRYKVRGEELSDKCKLLEEPSPPTARFTQALSLGKESQAVSVGKESQAEANLASCPARLPSLSRQVTPSFTRQLSPPPEDDVNICRPARLHGLSRPACECEAKPDMFTNSDISQHPHTPDPEGEQTWVSSPVTRKSFRNRTTMDRAESRKLSKEDSDRMDETPMFHVKASTARTSAPGSAKECVPLPSESPFSPAASAVAAPQPQASEPWPVGLSKRPVASASLRAAMRRRDAAQEPLQESAFWLSGTVPPNTDADVKSGSMAASAGTTAKAVFSPPKRVIGKNAAIHHSHRILSKADDAASLDGAVGEEGAASSKRNRP
jgi:hypothetical protein